MTAGFAAAPDGTRLFVRTSFGERAEGTTAILCDGIACDGFIWKYLWEELPAVMPVAHWNYRGHGRSAMPADPDRVDIPALAEDLMAVREHIGNPPCVLIGHSMGCQVALEELRRHHRDGRPRRWSSSAARMGASPRRSAASPSSKCSCPRSSRPCRRIRGSCARSGSASRRTSRSSSRSRRATSTPITSASTTYGRT